MSPLRKPTSETSPTMQNYPPPMHLKHRPIFMVPYEPFDGAYSGDTDALYLSLGLAQWREDDATWELSAKVWRMPEEKWSRLSEEIPFHRLVDLCVLLAKTFYQSHSTTAVDPVAVIAPGTFEHQTEELQLRRLVSVPSEFFDEENSRIKARLRCLRDELFKADLD